MNTPGIFTERIENDEKVGHRSAVKKECRFSTKYCPLSPETLRC